MASDAITMLWSSQQAISSAISNLANRFLGHGYKDAIENQHLRLIRLPDSTSFPLEFTIHTFPLGECPPYIALSYTWGPPNASQSPYTPRDRPSIRINGRSFPVLPNLFQALTHITACRPGRYLWVDSICINQGDTHERARQVGIMDLVYSGAAETIVWLGTSTEKTKRALSKVAALADGAEDKIKDWVRDGALGDVFVADDPTLLDKNGLPVMTTEDWMDISDVFARTWFGRVWMIQEIALSTAPTVLIGSDTVSWDTIGNAAVVIAGSNAIVGLHVIGPGAQNIPLTMGIIYALGLQIMRTWCRGEDSPFGSALGGIDFTAGVDGSSPIAILLGLLHGSSGFRATVRRDRVYALIGIANHMARARGFLPISLDIDYTSSDNQVITALGLNLLRKTRSLSLISLAGETSRSANSKMPSWIPSFENRHAPLLGPTYTILRQYNACASSPDTPPVFTIDEPLGRLHVRAISPNLGTIDAIGETFHEALTSSLPASSRILLHCGNTYQYTGEPIVEAFWRTLITDTYVAQRPAPSDLSTSFAAWTKLITISALCANYASTRSLFDTFDTLESLFILANSRDATHSLPTSDAMIGALTSIGLIDDSSVPRLSQAEIAELTASLGKTAAPYEGLLRLMLLPGRRLVSTIRGYICLAPLQARVGDKVMIVQGCPVPLVLRRVEGEQGSFKVIGDVYVHGAMFGEHVTEDSVWRDICLV